MDGDKGKTDKPITQKAQSDGTVTKWAVHDYR